MLYVLLVILKVIGIVILAILLTLLFLLTIVLFVPIRYQVYASKNAEIYAKAKASWLLHLIHFSFHFDRNGFQKNLKILGISADKWKDFINKIKSLFTVKKKNKRNKVKKSKDLSKKQNKNANTKVEEKRNHVRSDRTNESNTVEIKEPEALNEQIQQRDKNVEQNINIDISKDTSNMKSDYPIEPKEDKNNEKRVKLPSYYIKKWYKRVKQRLKTLFQKIKNLINNIILTFKNAKDKLEEIKSLIRDEGNKQAFILCKEQLVLIIKHIKPKKYRINLKFGTGDPALTGQILGILGMLMPLYKNNANIVPDFENMIFEGDIFMKGRITIARVLLIGWKLYRDENVKRCYKMIMD